jgi:hypothetical protein
MEAEKEFRDVFDAIAEMQAIHAKSYLDLDNIEVLFGAVEMAQSIGKLAKRQQEEIERLRTSVISLIVKTLENSIKFPVRNRGIYPPSPYGDFVEMLSNAKSNARQGDTPEFAFLTFNYDLTLDLALTSHGLNFEYCLKSEKAKQISPYLKLHGSINWGSCNKCHQIIPFYVRDAHFDLWPDTQWVYYDLGSRLFSRKHCDEPLKSQPVLVPPTWNKTEYHNQLASVWKRAAEELASAENVFIIGYSLPETDSFFRYLFALGSESSTRIRRFWVFNPDPDHTVEPRFRALVGRGIENRFRFERRDFENSIPIMAEALARP